MSDIQRYDGPPHAGDEPTLHVLFHVGGTECVLPSDIVIQMESFTGATPVPGAPPFVVGIVQVRGRVVPVVDLRLRFGHEPSVVTADSRLVIGQHGERVVGLLVDRAREVVKLSRAQLRPPPPILELDARGFVKAVAQLGPRLLMLVDFAKVIGEESADVVE
jgi:purine-binding chemotaxis protein CheW